MLVDLEPGEDPKTHHSSICIIGGGIAGLTLARSLSRSELNVNVLEAGGLHDEPRYQELNYVENSGRPHGGASSGRFRVFGGSSSRWGGQVLPFTPDVLAPPAELEMPSWPLCLSDIEPYFFEVENTMGTNKLPFSSDLLDSFSQNYPFISSDVAIRFSKWAPYRNRNLAKTLGRNCIAANRICIFLHSNVTRLQMREDGSSIESVLVTTMAGVMHRFVADVFVLCVGTIEASRLLLSSDDVCAAGVGNNHDQVGRYFHDHISIRAASLPAATQENVTRHFTPRRSKGTLHSPKLEAASELRRKQRLLSVMAHFPVEEPMGAGLDSVRTVLRQMQAGKFDSKARRAMLRLPVQSLELSSLLWNAYLKKKRPLSKNARLWLQIDCEQRPRAESRICLSEKRDALGSRIASIHWQISDEERHTVQTYARVLDKLFNENGFGDLEWSPEIFRDDDSWLDLSTETLHMMGGTRMGANPATSVVDSELRVHGVANLYVASCSVFPTGGSSNPTFTMMALTLRLSERLRRLTYQRQSSS